MSVNILLVEDNQGDIRLLHESLKECKIEHVTNVVNDGESAIRYLNREAEYSSVIQPNLVILDLNLPGIKGYDVLSFIKSTSDIKHIPVIVLTASQDKKDIVMTYSLCANCYVCKPIDFDDFIEVVKSITNFWFNIVKLPGEL